ncbi:hypothetical protein H7H80_12575, partial [Mycobacterium interjectum]|nr:hypothetical protein [Mycobacterium interjectum]
RAADPPHGEPAYVSGVQESAEVSSGALTKPRGWRRQRPEGGSHKSAYLRWPHPQG